MFVILLDVTNSPDLDVRDPYVESAIVEDLRWLDDASPFGNKIRNILDLKGIPYAIVKVRCTPWLSMNM